jgi:L-iditol 2-dehydrogenase
MVRLPMRAIRIARPRAIEMLDDAPRPECGEGQVLVKCSHIALCGSNMGQYTGEGLWGDIEFPNPVGWAGHENIGVIVESRCEGWQEGDVVLAQPKGYYGFAEYIVSEPPAIGRLPKDSKNLAPFVVAQPLATVLRAMTRTDNVIAKRCAVTGQGPMGLIFTHVLRMMGASEVIATDLLDWRLEWSKRYGARHVINAASEDAVAAAAELTGGKMLDFVVEASGRAESLAAAARMVRTGGRLFVFGMPHFEEQVFPWYQVFRQNVQINTCVGPECGAFFQTAVDMVLDERCGALTEMVTPVMRWADAAEAFEMYAGPAKDSLKLTLEL